MERGRIDYSVGKGNALFLGDVANGTTRAQIEKNFREGRYPDLHTTLARNAMSDAGLKRRG